VSRAPCALAS